MTLNVLTIQNKVACINMMSHVCSTHKSSDCYKSQPISALS